VVRSIISSHTSLRDTIVSIVTVFSAHSSPPRECREHAKNCHELANNAPPSSLGRARFEELAKTWMRLATDADRANALLKRWGDPSFGRPVKNWTRTGVGACESDIKEFSGPGLGSVPQTN